MAVNGTGSSVHIAASVLPLSIQEENISLAGNAVTLHIDPITKRILTENSRRQIIFDGG